MSDPAVPAATAATAPAESSSSLSSSSSPTPSESPVVAPATSHAINITVGGASDADSKESKEHLLPSTSATTTAAAANAPSGVEMTSVSSASVANSTKAPTVSPNKDHIVQLVSSVEGNLFGHYTSDGYHPPAELKSSKKELKDQPRHARHLLSYVRSHLSLPYYLQWPLFWFPFHVNETSSRLVAFFAAIVSIIIIIFRTEIWAYYVTVALFADFTMRFTFGGRGSFLGIAADALSRFFPKKLISGAQKQFAALCGAMFTGWAAVAFWLNRANSPSSENGATGSVLLGILAGCAALEFFLNFCVGCFFFGLMQRFNIISRQCNERASSILGEEMRARAEIEDDPGNLMVPEPFELHSVALGSGRSLDVSYKTSYEKWKRHNFHLIKQCKVHYFIIPVSATGLAVAWKFASDNSIFGTDNVVWQILGIFALILYCVQFILYSLKLLLYTEKVINEWNNLFSINGFILIPAGAVLFIPLLIDNYEVLGRAIFWIFAPFVLLMSVTIVGKWVQQLYMTSVDLVTPDFLLPVVANLICAVCLPIVYYEYDNFQYNEPAYLWWAFSTFAYFLISSFLLFRIITASILEDRSRCSLFLLMCGSALIGIAYLSINSYQWDPFAYFVLYLSYFYCLLYLFLGAANYFCRHRWDISYFSFAFPLETMAILSMLHYQQEHDNGLVQAIATTLMVITNGVVACQFLHVVSCFTHRITLFTTELEEKFNPLAFMRLCHFAFREAFYRMRQLIPHIDGKLTDGVVVMNEEFDKFVELTTQFRVANTQHARWEERYMFVEVRRWWPGTTDVVDKQHLDHEHSDEYKKVLDLANVLRERIVAFQNSTGERDPKPVEEARESLSKEVKTFEDECQTHWKIEERHLLNRKFVNWQTAKEVVGRMVRDTPMHELKITLPFVVENQFIHSRRIKLIRSLLLSVPEQAQLLGKLIYEGVSHFMWLRLVADIPQIAPKNTERYTKIL